MSEPKTYKIELSEERLTLLKVVLQSRITYLQDERNNEEFADARDGYQEMIDSVDDLLTHIKNETE